MLDKVVIAAEMRRVQDMAIGYIYYQVYSAIDSINLKTFQARSNKCLYVLCPHEPFALYCSKARASREVLKHLASWTTLAARSFGPEWA